MFEEIEYHDYSFLKSKATSRKLLSNNKNTLRCQLNVLYVNFIKNGAK